MTVITLKGKSKKKLSLIEELARELGITVQKGVETTGKSKVAKASKDELKLLTQAHFLKGYAESDAVYDKD